MNFGDTRLPSRFWNKVQPCPMTGCWLFMSSQDPIGYGSVGYAGRVMKAHRVTYEVLVGEVPTDLELDHRCKVRCCCNPDHLEPVSHTENMRRSFNATKDRCRHGHSLHDARVYQGRRYCLHCGRTHSRNRQRRVRAAEKAARKAPK